MISQRGTPPIDDQTALYYRLLLALPAHLQIMLLISSLFVLSTFISTIILLTVAFYGHSLRKRNVQKRRDLLMGIKIDEKVDGKKRIVGFFHPYCNAGGGGERVLWTAIACLQSEEKELICVVYTGDAVNVSKADMITKVETRFGIILNPSTLIFIPLKRRYLVEDSTWKRFTLLGQSVGSIFLVLEGLTSGLIPDIWIDTMGYAFAYPLVRILGRIAVGSYTHYPTISTDMLNRVSSRKAGHTNTSLVAKSAILTYLKLFYYIIFAELYSVCLRQADILMVNSTWTKNHINRLLRPFAYRDDTDDDVEEENITQLLTSIAIRASSKEQSGIRQRSKTDSSIQESLVEVTKKERRFKVATTVYPPCDTISLAALPLELRERVILSVAQFRPEKDHQVQLHALKSLFDLSPKYKSGRDSIKLKMAGSVRNKGDENRVESLRKLAKELEIEDNVEFVINVPYPELIELFGTASIGLHTMVDEHFGITAVEFMAAGLIPLVHASAGPLLDIVLPFNDLPTGYHATTAVSFAEKLNEILELSEIEKGEMRLRARMNAVERFSTERFEKGWLKSWRELVKLEEVGEY